MAASGSDTSPDADEATSAGARVAYIEGSGKLKLMIDVQGQESDGRATRCSPGGWGRKCVGGGGRPITVYQGDRGMCGMRGNVRHSRTHALTHSIIVYLSVCSAILLFDCNIDLSLTANAVIMVHTTSCEIG
jgi:hypothetical protein